MAETKTPENQQELFSEFSQESQRPQRFPSLAKSHKPILFSVTMEQILLAGILLILLMCFVFFLGVLRGKSFRMERPASVAAPAARVVTAPAAPAPVAIQPVAVPQASVSTTVFANTVTTRPKFTVDDPLKPYSIQLVTYKQREYAEKEAKGLRRLGFFTTIIPSGDYYQVCAGQYASSDEARRDLAYFSSKYKGCFLRRR